MLGNEHNDSSWDYSIGLMGLQFWDAFKVAHVAGDHDQVAVNRRGGAEQIKVEDVATRSPEVSPGAGKDVRMKLH